MATADADVVEPLVTSFYAAVLALVFLALTGWVSAGRRKFRVNHGDGGHPQLNRRIRAHANFAEYVPLALLLVALLEAGGADRWTLHAMLLPLLVARVLHPIGMVAPEMSVRQVACRGVGACVTWLVLLAASVLLLVRVV